MADIFVRDANLVALMEKTGYNITQENGQRKFGPPPGWIGPPPPKGSEIFIGKLPRDVYEDELVPLCDQFGKIYELRLMMDYNVGNRGYAFATYTNNDDATKAIKHLDDYEIRPGRHIGVCKSIDNCRLFVGGIPKEKSKEEIGAEISRFTEGVSKVILYSSVIDKTRNRGFAFIEYETHRAAAMAKRKLLSNKIKLFDHEIAVDWAQPEAQVEEETMKRVTVLYVRNLSNKTTEEQLYVLFSMGGALKIERVKKLRDFAFIHYCKREDADLAREKFDGILLDECVIEVTWAKPPESHKQKLVLERNTVPCCYKQISCNLDHSFDVNMPSSPSLPFLSRMNTRQRLQLSNMGNLPSSVTVTRPIQLLLYVCVENSWGTPVFQVSRLDSDPTEISYICLVIIPNLPVHVRRFLSDKICYHPEEAKHYAACQALKKLGIIDSDIPFVTSAHHSMPSMYTNHSKNSFSNGSSNIVPKPASNLGLFSPAKNSPLSSFKTSAPTTPHTFFGEHGQGDNAFLSSPQTLVETGDIENCPPLLDPDTPIEPTSFLGLLSTLAAVSNMEIPLFNKPKL